MSDSSRTVMNHLITARSYSRSVTQPTLVRLGTCPYQLSWLISPTPRTAFPRHHLGPSFPDAHPGRSWPDRLWSRVLVSRTPPDPRGALITAPGRMERV